MTTAPQQYPQHLYGLTFSVEKFDAGGFVIIAMGKKNSDHSETFVHELVHLAGDPAHIQGTITGNARSVFGKTVRDRVLDASQQELLRTWTLAIP